MVFMLILTCFFGTGEPLLFDAFQDLEAQIDQGLIGAEAEVTLALNSEENIQALIGMTSKGNGSIDVLGLRIRIYDAHQDLVTYQNNLLDGSSQDINGDGYLDLIFSGVAIVSDEKGEFFRHEAVVIILLYVPREKTFELIYVKTPEELSREILVSRLH